MERTYSEDLKPGKSILVKGWIKAIRDIGSLKFFILRDRTGTVQITIKKGNVPDNVLQIMSKLGREDCISIHGHAKKSNQAPGGLEIIPTQVELVSKAASPLPIEIGQSGKGKRFDYRFLDLRDDKIRIIFNIRDAIFDYTRQYFKKAGFIEVQTPVIQAAGAEGGASMFPLIYYQKEAFLRQSSQLYKQMLMASGLDKIYEIGPAFRAEAFHTRKHVSEFQSLDVELAWIESEEDVLKVLECCINFIFKELKKNNSNLLEKLGIKIKVPKIPFKRLTYDKVIELIKHKANVKWGDDLGDSEERALGEILTKKGIDWYFITKYPSQIKPFYIMFDGKYSRGFDLGYKGMEISSGGQREHRYPQLIKVMRSKGLDPAKFKFYLDAFRYGCPQMGGFGLGIDRVIQQVLNLPDIKEAIMFPRTPENLVP